MTKKILWTCIAIAVLIRLAVFLVLDSRHDEHVFWLGDTVGYMQIADNVVAGHGFSMATTSPYIPDGMRTPVLPYLLAFTKGNTGTPVPYILFQIALSIVIILLSYEIARLVTANEKIAVAVAIFSALEPYSIFINMSLLTETVFSALMLGGVYAACLYIRDQKPSALVTASALFALAALTRPIAQFLPVILILLVVFRAPVRLYAKHIALVLVSFVLVLSPWLIRNYETFGSVNISSGGYQNVYSDLGATIISYRDGVEWYIAKDKLNKDFATSHGVDESALQQDPSLSPALLRAGVDIMMENPVSTLRAFTTVGIAFLTNDVWTYYPQYWGWMSKFEYGFSPTHMLMAQGPIVTLQRVVEATGGGLLIPVVGRLFWLFTSALFFAGVVQMCFEKGNRRLYALLFLAIVLYMLALCLSNGAGINGRYRYPINSLLYVPALYAAGSVLKRLMVLWRRHKADI